MNESAQDQVTPEQARALLRAERRQREAQCQEAIQQVLTTYNCVLKAQPYVGEDGRILARIVLAGQE